MDREVLKRAGIDYDAALARFVGKQELYERFLQKFLEDEHIADAAEAFADGNLAEVLEQVHALKGIAGTLGMVVLYEKSAEVVSNLRNQETEALAEKMDGLQAECSRIKALIKSCLDSVEG